MAREPRDSELTLQFSAQAEPSELYLPHLL